MVEYRCIRFDELSSHQLETWQQFCDHNSSFRSPYFQPRFAQAVNQVRPDVFVILAELDERLVAILPIQVPIRKRAFPIGGRLNDLQGMIAADDFVVDSQKMLNNSGLNSYSFHAAQRGKCEIESSQFEMTTSPVIDLRRGFDDYFQWVTKASRTIKRQGQKTRRMISELGPLRFEFHCKDPAVFDRVVELKRKKYKRTKTFDLFSVPWASRLIRKIYLTEEPRLAGVLSVLWAGDQLVAGHIGLRSQRVLHYWFPVFDPSHFRYSPGIQLLLEICRHSQIAGIDEIDLGYGDQPFKYKLANRQYQTVCGKISRSGAALSLSRKAHFARKWLMRSPVHPVAKRIVRTLHPGFGKRVFR